MGNGLAYDIYQNTNLKEVVFAARGSDGWTDWASANMSLIESPQYKKFKQTVGDYINKNPDKKVFVTGHSLGGGLSLSASISRGIDAIVFDSSPRIFDDKNDRQCINVDDDGYCHATRVLIYEDKEIMEFARKIWRKVKDLDSYECQFNNVSGLNKIIKKHDLYPLALELLKQGAKVNEDLKKVYESMEDYKSKIQ